MKQKITLLLGAAVSVGCLYWVFKDVDFKQFAQALKSINPLWLCASLALFYWSMYLRAVRWGLLFKPALDLNGRRLFRPIMICFAFNSIMPGRVGELVRALFVSKRENTGLPMAFATVVSERIFDGVTLLSCLAISLWLLPPIDPNVRVAFGKFVVEGSMLRPLVNKVIVLCVILILGVIFLMIPGIERHLERFIRAIPAMPEGAAGRIVNIVKGIIRGFESVRDFKNLSLIIFYSILIWFLVVASNLVLAWGVNGVEHVSFLQSMAIVTMITIFIMIPDAPGYWGLYEAGVLFGLKVLGVQENETIGTAYAIIMHLVQYVPIVIIGLTFAAQSQVKVSEAKSEVAN